MSWRQSFSHCLVLPLPKPSGRLQSFRVGQVGCRQSLEIFEHFDPWVFPTLSVIEFFSDGFISSSHDFFKVVFLLRFFLLNLKRVIGVDEPDCFVLPKVTSCFLHVSVSIDFVDRTKILSLDFMDDVRTVAFVPVFLFEEAELPGLAKLHRTRPTSLRLLLRFQLSSPLEDIGPFSFAS